MISCLLKYLLIFLVAPNFTQKSAAVSTPAKTNASPETIMSSSTAESTSLSSTESSTTSSSAVPSETSPSSSINPTTNTITTSSASMPSGASTFSSTNETIAPTLKTYPNNLAGITIFSCLIFIAACALIAIFVLSHLKKRGRQAFDQEKAMDNTQVVTEEDQSFRNKPAFDVSQTQPTQMSRGASLEKTQTSEIGLEKSQASE